MYIIRVRIRHLSNLQGHVIPCWGASRVGMITAGWPLRGGRGKKKYQKNKKIKNYFPNKCYWPRIELHRIPDNVVVFV